MGAGKVESTMGYVIGLIASAMAGAAVGFFLAAAFAIGGARNNDEHL